MITWDNADSDIIGDFEKAVTLIRRAKYLIFPETHSLWWRDKVAEIIDKRFSSSAVTVRPIFKTIESTEE